MIMSVGILFFVFLLFLISTYNLVTAPRLEKLSSDDRSCPKVSILIPVRNEARNISQCLESIFSLQYAKKEVIVYDDQSEDSTLEILDSYRKKNSALKILEGTVKPVGFTGKSWACHNLSKAAQGDLLLFIDADVIVASDCLTKVIPFAVSSDISLLSCFPKQNIKSFGEWLVVPLMNWILLSLLPLKLVYTAAAPSLAAANGQFMLFRRHAYEAIGGHEAVKSDLVEDVAFARIIKQSGRKVMTTLTHGAVSCRMYEGFEQSIEGFTKNFYPGFKMPKIVFLVFIAALFFGFFVPFVLVLGNKYYLPHVLIILLSRVFVAFSSRQNIFLNVLLHPVQMICMLAVGVRSVFAAATGNIYWKDRRV